MNSIIIKQVLPICELWDLDLYIWKGSKFIVKYKKGTYSVSFDNPFLYIHNFEVQENNLRLVHYLEIKTIKIKTRINIVVSGSWIDGSWVPDQDKE